MRAMSIAAATFALGALAGGVTSSLGATAPETARTETAAPALLTVASFDAGDNHGNG